MQTWSSEGRGLVYVAIKSTDGQVYSNVQVRVSLMDIDNTAYLETTVDVPIVGPTRNTNAYLPFNLILDKPTDFRVIEVLGATPVPGAVMIEPVPFGVIAHRKDYNGNTPIVAKLQNKGLTKVENLHLVADVLTNDNWPIAIYSGQMNTVSINTAEVKEIEIQPRLPGDQPPGKTNMRAYAFPVGHPAGAQP